MKVRRDGTPEVTAAGTLHDQCSAPYESVARQSGGPRAPALGGKLGALREGPSTKRQAGGPREGPSTKKQAGGPRESPSIQRNNA